MQVLIRTKNFSVTQGLQQLIQTEAEKLDKVAWKILRVEAFLEVSKKQARALIVAVRAGKDIVVEERTGDIHQAVALALEKTQRALRKNREKRLSMRRQVAM